MGAYRPSRSDMSTRMSFLTVMPLPACLVWCSSGVASTSTTVPIFLQLAGTSSHPSKGVLLLAETASLDVCDSTGADEWVDSESAWPGVLLRKGVGMQPFFEEGEEEVACMLWGSVRRDVMELSPVCLLNLWVLWFLRELFVRRR